MMMEGCRNGDKGSCNTSIGATDNTSIMGATDNLEESDIKLVTESWMKVQKVLDAAIASFYKDLISSKAEVRNLFSKSNATTSK